MKKNACFRVSVDEVAENLAKFVALAKTQTFEIYDEGEVEVMLVRISAIPEWNENLQRSIRLDMLTEEERKSFSAPSGEFCNSPDNYHDWQGEGD